MEGAPPPAFGDALGGYRFRLWGLPDDAVRTTEGRDVAFAMRALVAARARQQGIDPDAVRLWVDHTPSNLHNWRLLDDTFPDARFVHIVRDGRAVALSLKSVRWGPNDVEASAQWWLSRLSTALMCELALGAECVLRVRYEDLVSDPATALGRVCAFIGVEYEPSMAAGGGYRLPKYWNHGHTLVARSPDASRIGAWARDLSASDIERFEAAAGPALEFFDYPLRYGGGARPSALLERLRRGASEFVRFYLMNPPRHMVEILRASARVRRDPTRS
jgi:hypothetical protein